MHYPTKYYKYEPNWLIIYQIPKYPNNSLPDKRQLYRFRDQR